MKILSRPLSFLPFTHETFFTAECGKVPNQDFVFLCASSYVMKVEMILCAFHVGAFQVKLGSETSR